MIVFRLPHDSEAPINRESGSLESAASQPAGGLSFGRLRAVNNLPAVPLWAENFQRSNIFDPERPQAGRAVKHYQEFASPESTRLRQAVRRYSQWGGGIYPHSRRLTSFRRIRLLLSGISPTGNNAVWRKRPLPSFWATLQCAAFGRCSHYPHVLRSPASYLKQRERLQAGRKVGIKILRKSRKRLFMRNFDAGIKNCPPALQGRRLCRDLLSRQKVRNCSLYASPFSLIHASVHAGNPRFQRVERQAKKSAAGQPASGLASGVFLR